VWPPKIQIFSSVSLSRRNLNYFRWFFSWAAKKTYYFRWVSLIRPPKLLRPPKIFEVSLLPHSAGPLTHANQSCHVPEIPPNLPPHAAAIFRLHELQTSAAARAIVVPSTAVYECRRHALHPRRCQPASDPAWPPLARARPAPDATENRPITFLPDIEFSTVSVKITVRNKIFFGGHVIATESFEIFAGHAKAPKIVLFSAATFEINPYF
jgi:hypothetical protein